MFTQSLDHLDPSQNRVVLKYLSSARPSAHSEVADALLHASAPLGEYQRVCPDPAKYSYLLLSTSGIAFALARGMSSVSFRLHRELLERAVLSGASIDPELGEPWATFVLFRSDWPEPDLRFWALKAYDNARTDGSEARIKNLAGGST